MREIWFVDFEYFQPDGELPLPLCVAAYEMNSKRWVKLSRHELPVKPPYSVGDDSIFVSFAADAELLCHYVLKWPFPKNVVDLHVEYLNYSNYIERADSKNREDKLLEVLAQFQIDHIDSAEKEAMRKIAETGGPRTPGEEVDLLNYCASDVLPLPQLFRRLIGEGNLKQALARSEYMKPVTLMQAAGIPIDVPRFKRFQASWESIKAGLIAEVDKDFHVYDGVKFSLDKFRTYLKCRDMDWPMTPKLKLPATDKETFKEQVNIYPEIAPLHELVSTLRLMKKNNLPVGSDGRNRSTLHAFRSKTGRNQPPSSKFLFGAPSWMRSFAKPPPRKALVYVDFMAEEFAIAGALSGDKAMQHAYVSGAGDPYLSFAKMANALPANATKQTHPVIRDLFKQCCLGIQYAMQAQGLARRIGRSVAEAEVLIEHHKTQFPVFWHWVDRVVTHMEFKRSLCTKSGWRVMRRFRGFPAKYRRSTQNWLIQSTGADLLREVCCRVTKAGFVINAPVHDALVVEDFADRIEQTVGEVRRIMGNASVALLGFEIFTEEQIFYDRFVDKRGIDMWARINKLMDECDGLSAPKSGFAGACDDHSLDAAQPLP